MKALARDLCPPVLWRLLSKARKPTPSRDGTHLGRKAHYGSADRILNGWVNIDLADIDHPGYIVADLTQRHPFPDGWLKYGFAEDFLEHLDQEQSLRFLIEVHRTLEIGGVLRLSFPGLEGVLSKHYPDKDLACALLARSEAYDMHGHRHFYSFDELRTVSRHIGFRACNAVPYGESDNVELRGLEYREAQASMNIHAELVK